MYLKDFIFGKFRLLILLNTKKSLKNNNIFDKYCTSSKKIILGNLEVSKIIYFTFKMNFFHIYLLFICKLMFKILP